MTRANSEKFRGGKKVIAVPFVKLEGQIASLPATYLKDSLEAISGVQVTVDSPDSVTVYIPAGQHGRITSRARSLGWEKK